MAASSSPRDPAGERPMETSGPSPSAPTWMWKHQAPKRRFPASIPAGSATISGALPGLSDPHKNGFRARGSLVRKSVHLTLLRTSGQAVSTSAIFQRLIGRCPGKPVASTPLFVNPRPFHVFFRPRLHLRLLVERERAHDFGGGPEPFGGIFPGHRGAVFHFLYGEVRVEEGRAGDRLRGDAHRGTVVGG